MYELTVNVNVSKMAFAQKIQVRLNLGYIYSWLSVNHGRMASKENRRFSFHDVGKKQTQPLEKRLQRGSGASGNRTPQM